MNCFIYLVVTVLVLKSLSAENSETGIPLFIPVEVLSGQSAELPCNVTAENENDKLTILAWYKDNSRTAFYSRDLRGKGNPNSTTNDSRYRLVTDDDQGLYWLHITNVSRSDRGVYHCVADFAASPVHKTHVQLDIIEPPVHLWVVFENGTQVAKASVGVNTSRNIGPYYVGDTVRLACVAYGGKPQASISWWSDQQLVKNRTTVLSELRVRSDLKYGPLEAADHGLVFTCYATNNEKVLPLTIDITVDMYVPPNLVTVRSEDSESNGRVGRVRAGEALSLQCRVLGARPLPTDIVWKLNNNPFINLEQNMTKEPSQRLVVSDIQLTLDREHDESQVTCCAPAYQRDSDQLKCASPLPLNVLYPPVLEIVVNDDVDNNTLAVLKGSNLSLSCKHEANPSVYELYWFHKDIFITNATSNSGKPIQQVLELSEVSESDAGQYYCVASNVEGSTCSNPITVDVTYPAYCQDEERIEYGVGENEVIEINCTVVANPSPATYRWVIVNEVVDSSTFDGKPHTTVETEGGTMSYQRPNGTTYSTIFCWGQNDVPAKYLPHTPCTFLITDQTIPRPPKDCEAMRNAVGDIVISCEKGYNGGLSQRFKFIVQAVDSEEELVSIINQEPNFMIQEPKSENYKFVIIAFNDKGESRAVEIEKDSIIEEELLPKPPRNTVANITTLALGLCGGVALVALAACGLVLCTYERSSRADLPRPVSDPPLCAYNTEESNCETYHDSDEGSECNVRRTESFRRAVSRQPSKNFDVRRTSSFHSARYMHDMAEQETAKCNDTPRHSNHCRVHSLQNINRKREMDALCDHLVLHLPPETNYNIPRPMNTFYTMPRKMRHKLAKELSDENSEITQNSDGFSLPPPPDEFTTYRAGTRIKDMPTKSMPTYTTVIRKNSSGKEPTRQQYNNVIISPMNTVGLPTVSGGQHSLYSYPDDEHHGHHQVNTNPFDEDSS